jgi:hypothetical protein
LTTLPDNLPKSLELLHCSNNQLTTLPNNLPKSLEYLHCSNNQLTTLPNNLPKSLESLNCNNNQLTTLPDLPPSLVYLHCSNNQLTTLPTNLPPSLQILECRCNQLTTLPDTLPSSLRILQLFGNPQLCIKYPDLFNDSYSNHMDKIAYINTINSKTRITERTKQINKDNILLELYMKRAMHPHKIKHVVGDDIDVDIDKAMSEYIETL